MTERYSIDEFIMLLKEYDFKNNSVRKFANNYKVSEKTVIKYLKQNNIEHNSKTLIINRNRDVNGRFCLNIKPEAFRLNKFGRSTHEHSEFNRDSKSIADKLSLMDNERKTIEKINPSKNLSEKSYEEKLKRIARPFK